MLRCYRYIELNPVRADMVSHPAEYRWSSYRTNAQGEVSAIVQPHTQYKLLGSTIQARQSAYRELFRYHLNPGIVDEIRSATNGNFALWNARFKEQVSAALGRRVMPGKSGRPTRQERTSASDLFETEK